ncbi:hypothetical protein [Streptomyces sp. NPDC002825]|uniref:hypothetical protein n=1 Tax=Streptomyces sp. NPDC002825 TaxID=3154666 RepID=UPI0033316F47
MTRTEHEADQIVFRWDSENLTGSTGFGPVAWSGPRDEAENLFRVSGPVLRASGDEIRPALIRLRERGYVMLIRRVPFTDADGRTSVLCHALVGAPSLLKPFVCLGLHGWEWEGAANAAGARGRLPVVPAEALAPGGGLAELDRRLPYAAEELVGAVAEFLRHPEGPFTILDERGGTAYPVLWGLQSILGAVTRHPWTFATHDTAELPSLQFAFVGRWSGAASRNAERRRVDPRERCGDRAEDVATRLVRHHLAEVEENGRDHVVARVLHTTASTHRGPLLDTASRAADTLDDLDHRPPPPRNRPGRSPRTIPAPAPRDHGTQPSGYGPPQDPRPDQRTRDPRPGQGARDPRSGEGDRDPRSGEGDRDPRPGQGAPAPRPGQGARDPRPVQGAPDPRPVQDARDPRPGRDAPDPRNPIDAGPRYGSAEGPHDPATPGPRHPDPPGSWGRPVPGARDQDAPDSRDQVGSDPRYGDGTGSRDQVGSGSGYGDGTGPREQGSPTSGDQGAPGSRSRSGRSGSDPRRTGADSPRGGSPEPAGSSYPASPGPSPDAPGTAPASPPSGSAESPARRPGSDDRRGESRPPGRPGTPDAESRPPGRPGTPDAESRPPGRPDTPDGEPQPPGRPDRAPGGEAPPAPKTLSAHRTETPPPPDVPPSRPSSGAAYPRPVLPVVGPEWTGPGKGARRGWGRRGRDARTSLVHKLPTVRSPEEARELVVAAGDQELLDALRRNQAYVVVTVLLREIARRLPSWEHPLRRELCEVAIGRKLWAEAPPAARDNPYEPEEERRAANAAELYRWAVRPLLAGGDAPVGTVAELLSWLRTHPEPSACETFWLIVDGERPGLPDAVWLSLLKEAYGLPRTPHRPGPPLAPGGPGGLGDDLGSGYTRRFLRRAALLIGGLVAAIVLIGIAQWLT